MIKYEKKPYVKDLIKCERTNRQAAQLWATIGNK